MIIFTHVHSMCGGKWKSVNGSCYYQMVRNDAKRNETIRKMNEELESELAYTAK